MLCLNYIDTVRYESMRSYFDVLYLLCMKYHTIRYDTIPYHRYQERELDVNDKPAMIAIKPRDPGMPRQQLFILNI